jgi:putative DNA primase/helicase
MRQAGWTEQKAYEHILKVGWHGIETESGGLREISTTINSAYRSGYTFSYKNDIIAHNMTHAEQMRIQAAYTSVSKARRETDKIRFSNYEREILIKYPYIRKNEIGLVFNYVGGVYKMMTDQELEGIILNGLYEDMLWGFRTNKSVSDKISCLLSIIPDLELTDDKGYIANVKNGLLNIMTKELMPHTPDFVSLVQYNVVYDPKATCPNWNACLKAWVEGPESEKKELLLQQFSGYCLSSSMTYDKALFIVGDGGNGKSTFVDTIAMVIGNDAVSHIDLESLYGQYGMKGLIGKRLNVIEEVAGNYYQSNKLKKLISGEKVTIDIKYKDQFSFRPQAKFIFAVNLMPRVDDTSTATERRTLAINFKNNFRRNPNTALRTASGLLASELSGILNWMIEGAAKLRDLKGFVETNEQVQMLSEYRQENSSVEGFIAECLTMNQEKIVTSVVVYDEYKKYCTADGRKFKSKIAFTKEMAAYGKRYGTFEYFERSTGKETSRFVGFEISDAWKDENDAFRDYRGHIVS